MPTIKDILKTKGNDVHSISPEAKVFDALKLMADKGVGALVVLKEGNIVGVISERDYARKVILMGKLSKDIPVQDIMTSEIICINPDQVPAACLALMTDKHVRHMPVLENDQLVGIVSIGDLVKSIISDQKLRIDQLEHYVRGTL